MIAWPQELSQILTARLQEACNEYNNNHRHDRHPVKVTVTTRSGLPTNMSVRVTRYDAVSYEADYKMVLE